MPHQRIHFVDLLRGLAVIVMVVGHSIDSVLGVEARATEWFRIYTVVRGFTAPVFLFVSGLAFMIATEKRWNAYLSFGSETGKRIGKLLLLFAVGYALHFPYFSLNKTLRYATPEEYAQFFQVDILQCVAAGLLLLHVFIVLTRTPNVFVWTTIATGSTIVIITPFIAGIDFSPFVSPFFAPYFNDVQRSLFPLFPYAAFLFAGAVSGHFFLRSRQEGKEREFFVGMVWGSIGLLLMAFLLKRLPVEVLPPHDYWKASPLFFLVRLGIVMLFVTCFYFLRQFPETASRYIVRLGQASLLVYVVHLVIVYGSAANRGLAQRVGQALTPGESLMVALGVLLAMALLARTWVSFRKRNTKHVHVVQVAVASILLFLFVIKPY